MDSNRFDSLARALALVIREGSYGTIADEAGATLHLARARYERRRELLGAGACAPGSC